MDELSTPHYEIEVILNDMQYFIINVGHIGCRTCNLLSRIDTIPTSDYDKGQSIIRSYIRIFVVVFFFRSRGKYVYNDTSLIYTEITDAE